MNKYKVTIYFSDSLNVSFESEGEVTLENLQEEYFEKLKKDCFIERFNDESKAQIFNSKNILFIDIEEIKEEG